MAEAELGNLVAALGGVSALEFIRAIKHPSNYFFLMQQAVLLGYVILPLLQPRFRWIPLASWVGFWLIRPLVGLSLEI